MELIALGSVGPVTALCVYKEYIFTGCGSTVHVLRSGVCDLVTSLVALPCRTIHGFRLGPDVNGTKLVCVFGAKCARILKLDDGPLEDKSNVFGYPRLEGFTGVEEFEDWIWDTVWLQRGERWTVALALAHNIILHWDWQAGVLLQRATCTEKCILYCCHFIGERWSDLVLAAGTVFNQVVLWSPGQHVRGYLDQPAPVMHRLTGHKGVIFSIFYHHGLERICSASDDRSIIVYQLRFPTNTSDVEDGEAKARDWNQAIIEPMSTVFGHSGRVWDVVLLSDVFVSVGEDAYCIVWSYEGNILHKHKGHKGRSIWSLAASADETFVVTGGGDCSIRQWHLQEKSAPPQKQTQLAIPHSMKACSDDFVRTLALWDFDTVVLMTNAGSLLCYSVNGDKWQSLVHDSDFASYSAVAVSSDNTYLAVASITGYVRVLMRVEGGGSVRETKCNVHGSKICGLTWVDGHHTLTTGLQGHCVLARVQCTPDGALTVTQVARLELPVCRHRWMVSGCLVSLPAQSLSPCEKVFGATLIGGDRSGSIHCYQLTCAPTGLEATMPPTQTFPKIHGSAGVTCVCYHDNKVHSVGRDGQYRRWGLSKGQLQLLNSSRVLKGFDWIERLWIEKDSLCSLGFYSSKFLVWGQRQGEKLLEVECGGGHRAWDCRQQSQGYHFVFIKARKVVMVTAGHSSRQDIVKPPLHGMKVWEMKHICSFSDHKGGVHHVMCTGSEDTTLSLGTLSDKEGGLQWTGEHMLHAHLSSVRTVAVAQSLDTESPHTDTVSSSQFFPSTSFQNDSGIPAGTEKQSGQKKVQAVMFSAGGRAQIQAWRLTVSEGKGDQGGQNINAASAQVSQHDSVTRSKNTHCLPIAGLHSVRTSYEHLGGCFLGESRHKRQHKPWKTRYLKLDPETRIMSVAAVAAQQLDPRLSSTLYLLAAAGSDAALRLFLFDESKHCFTLLCQSWHHSGCILKVFISLHPSRPDPPPMVSQCPSPVVPLLFSAATDGQIAAWNLQSVVQWLVQDLGHVKTSPANTDVSDSGHATGDLSCGGDGDAARKGRSETSLVEQHEVDVSAGDVHTAGQVEHSPVHPTSVSREMTARSDCAEGKQCTGRTGQENCSLDDEDDDVESDDDDHTGQLKESSTQIQSNASRNQYLGDSPTVSLQEKLAEWVSGTEADKGWKDRGWSPDHTFTAHQSGVNSLHARCFPDGTFLLASGGDDNALTVHKLMLNMADRGPDTADRGPDTADREHGQGKLLDMLSVLRKSDAHAAQITGVWVLSRQHIVTASIDQRVNLWRLTRDSQVEMESCCFVDTADVSNMEVWCHRDRVYIGVCGEGVALLTMQGNRLEADRLQTQASQCAR